MPGTVGILGFGLISGAIGAVAMAIIIMVMEGKLPTTAPGIIAEKFFGDEKKKPLVLMPVMAMWGLVFGALVVGGVIQANYVGGIIVGVIAWLAMNLLMLPMAGAGIFGMKRWSMIPVMSGMMHLIWAVVTVFVYNSVLIGLLG